jgi:hypothetical protein
LYAALRFHLLKVLIGGLLCRLTFAQTLPHSCTSISRRRPTPASRRSDEFRARAPSSFLDYFATLKSAEFAALLDALARAHALQFFRPLRFTARV